MSVEIIKLMQYSGPSVLLIFAGLVWGKKVTEYVFDEMIEFKKLELNKDFENYKGKIERESKDFQHQLDTKLHEFNIRFLKLHQERADVIKELYNRIIELQTAMIAFTRKLQPIIEDANEEQELRLKRVNNAFQEFKDYFVPRKIYFKREIAGKLENLLNVYFDKGWDFAYINNQFKQNYLSNNILNQYYEKSERISEDVKYEIPKLIEDLESEFRSMLGVN